MALTLGVGYIYVTCSGERGNTMYSNTYKTTVLCKRAAAERNGQYGQQQKKQNLRKIDRLFFISLNKI